MFEAEFKIGNATILIQDGQLFIFFDGGEGDSVELTAEVERTLLFIAAAAAAYRKHAKVAA